MQLRRPGGCGAYKTLESHNDKHYVSVSKPRQSYTYMYRECLKMIYSILHAWCLSISDFLNMLSNIISNNAIKLNAVSVKCLGKGLRLHAYWEILPLQVLLVRNLELAAAVLIL